MNYIISDIHANIKALQQLMKIINPKRSDTLIFLGDYLDKNIYTKETVALLTELDKNYVCIFVKGDHEFVWDRYLNFQELFRQDFLLRYGSVEALKQFSNNSQQLIKDNRIDIIKECLAPYIKLISKMVDYHIVGNYLALHAGISKEQFSQEPIIFKEANYFLREHKIDMTKKYLNKYTIVAGHTHFDVKPLIKDGYINIDLGAGYGNYLSALCVEQEIVIRSDNAIYSLKT